MKVACENCKYWESRWEWLYGECPELATEDKDALRQKHLGACRRNPPVVVEYSGDVLGFSDYSGDATDFFKFPMTPSYEWCGEFKERASAPTKTLDGTGGASNQ